MKVARKRWVITRDGETAWNWDHPEERLPLFDADLFAATQVIISDDRTKPCATYNED